MVVLFLELMVAVSFVYSLFFLFIAFAPVHQLFLLFLWTLASALVYVLGSRKTKLLKISVILQFMPLLQYSNIMAVCFILASAVFTFLYMETSLLRGGSEDCVQNFKRTILVFLVATYLRSLPIIVFSGSLATAAPFITIYFLSSVFLIRSLRHLESGMDAKKIQLANLRYLIAICIISVLSVWGGGKNLLLSIVTKIPFWLAYAVVFLAESFWNFTQLLPKLPLEWQDWYFSINQRPPEEPPSEAPTVEEQLATWDTTILEIVIAILLSGFVIYFLYRVLLKAGNRKFSGPDFIEEREYIRVTRPRLPRRRRDHYSAAPGDQVRYYYRCFLAKLAGLAELKKSDTSLEVEEKAETVFSAGTGRIREIYIESRYGAKEPNKKTAAEMEKLCKDLRKNNK